jgi:N-acetylated-alpha-linked acidic dipeptidase
MMANRLVCPLLIAVATACIHDAIDLSKLMPRDGQVLPIVKAEFPPFLSDSERLLSSSFDNISISDWSYYYTHGDHVAGRNKSMADWTLQKWQDAGFSTSIAEYSVYLNYPISASLSLSRPDGTTYAAKLIEEPIQADETTSYPNSIPAFNGYSASGDVSAEYVYVG